MQGKPVLVATSAGVRTGVPREASVRPSTPATPLPFLAISPCALAVHTTCSARAKVLATRRVAPSRNIWAGRVCLPRPVGGGLARVSSGLATPRPPKATREKLFGLASLRDDSLISAAEFEALRARVLKGRTSAAVAGKSTPQI